MFKKSGMILVLALLAGGGLSVQAGSISIEGKASAFFPTDKVFRDIYKGGAAFGAEINFGLPGRLSLWVSGDYYQGQGRLTFTREKTKIEITPVCAGIRLAFSDSRFRPYVGVGAGYFRYKESNPIGSVSKGNAGLVAKIGLAAKISGPVFADLQADYTYCSVKPADVKADLGGLRASLGLGIAF